MRDAWLFLVALLCFVAAVIESWRGKPLGGRTPWMLLGLAFVTLVFLLDAWP